MSHDEINGLPLAAYMGPIQVVRTREQMLIAVGKLREETLLGFDTEKQPSFTRGESHPPALIQLAGECAVYVFQLGALGGLPAELAGVLSDGHVIKAGVAIGRDLQELQAMAAFEPRGFVDLGVRAMENGIQHHGLRGMAAIMLGCRISKGAKLTNWSRDDLSPAALQYAATDAWIGRRLYEAQADRLPGPGETGGRRRECRARPATGDMERVP